MNIEPLWYQKKKSILRYVLLPLALLFYLAVTFRQFLYRKQWIKTIRFKKPVIIVGNITVGGTGKTPFVIWLADFLKKNGLNPGIVSRGVGSQKKCYVPHWVKITDDPRQVGDEAILLAKRTHCPVVIAVNRAAAVETLLTHSDCNIVIADDGLQHYRLGRDIEIALIDVERGLGNGLMLPAGPLRESPHRLKQVDFLVYHGKKGQMILQEKPALPLAATLSNVSFSDVRRETWHAVTGIGHPARFFTLLRQQGFTILEHIFPDHHLFQPEDFHFNDRHPIIMTEKDAVKCQRFADERFWYLPVDAIIDPLLQQTLWNKIRKKFDAIHENSI